MGFPETLPEITSTNSHPLQSMHHLKANFYARHDKAPQRLRGSIAKRGGLNRASSHDKVHDDRDHRKQQEQVNEPARHVHQGETANPSDDQNNGKDKKHGFLFLNLNAQQRTNTMPRRYKP
jgi:hypothetical protein